VEEESLLDGIDHVLFAFSGGRDSVFLYHHLSPILRAKGIAFSGGYFNHALRRDSAQEESWVRHFWLEAGEELHVGYPPEDQWTLRHNLEARARELRRSFLEQVAARASGICAIALAHHQDDQAETMLLNLMRGTGLDGLGAMRPKKLPFIRPLLNVSREDIDRWFSQNSSQSWYEDPTNEETVQVRNRIRHEVFPLLRNIAPGSPRLMAQSALLLQGDAQIRDERVDEVLQGHLIAGRILDLEGLSGQTRAMGRLVTRAFLRQYNPYLRAIDRRHIEFLLAGSRAHSHLPGTPLRVDRGLLFHESISFHPLLRRIFPGHILYLAQRDLELYWSRDGEQSPPPWSGGFRIPIPPGVHTILLRDPKRSDRLQGPSGRVPQRVLERIRVAGFPPQMRPLFPVLVNEKDEPLAAVGLEGHAERSVEDRSFCSTLFFRRTHHRLVSSPS